MNRTYRTNRWIPPTQNEKIYFLSYICEAKQKPSKFEISEIPMILKKGFEGKGSILAYDSLSIKSKYIL